MRVPDFLTEHQIRFETLLHAPAFSAQQLAKYLHISGHQVAKSVLLKVGENFMLAVLPATHHIDTDQLERQLGTPVRLAFDREIACVFSDCEWGVVPPFGTLYGLSTLLDETIDRDAMIVFEGHSHFEAIRMRGGDFERLEKPRRLAFARSTQPHLSQSQP